MPPPCPSGKVQFTKKIDALYSIIYWERHAQPGERKPIRAYKCGFCGFYHLTSQQPKNEGSYEPVNLQGQTR